MNYIQFMQNKSYQESVYVLEIAYCDLLIFLPEANKSVFRCMREKNWEVIRSD